VTTEHQIGFLLPRCQAHAAAEVYAKEYEPGKCGVCGVAL
jgi:hypothetical protein